MGDAVACVRSGTAPRHHGATILPALVRKVDSWLESPNTVGLSGSLTLDDVEFHAPVFVETADIVRLDGREMDEYVLLTAVDAKEPMPLIRLNHLTVPCAIDSSLP